LANSKSIQEEVLRLTMSLLAAAVIIASGAAEAAWKEHPYKDLGFVVEFPDEPKVAAGNYRTVLVDAANVHIYSQKQDNALFVASVVDLQERAGEGASLMTEAEFNLSLLGHISDNSTSRVEPGRDSVFGRFITIDCQSGRIPDQPGQTEAAHAWFKNVTGGVECPDKGRLTVNMFFNRGRLYMIQGINLPNEDGSSSGPAALRFANSISFYRADGTRNRVDGAQ
jgi:hypothetical protein